MMRLNKTYSDLINSSEYKTNKINISCLDNRFSYTLSVGETLFMKVLDGEVVDLNYQYNDYLPEESDIAIKILHLLEN